MSPISQYFIRKHLMKSQHLFIFTTTTTTNKTFFSYSSIFAMRGLPTYIMNVLLVTLLPGSVGLGLHLPGSPEPNSGCRSWFRQSRILAIRLPFVFKNTYTPGSAGNTLRVVSRLQLIPSPVKVLQWKKNHHHTPDCNKHLKSWKKNQKPIMFFYFFETRSIPRIKVVD